VGPDPATGAAAVEQRAARLVLLLGALAVTALSLAAPAVADTATVQLPKVSFSAALDDQRLGLSSSGDPIVLDPDKASLLKLTMRNNTDQELTVRQVQLRGNTFGITLMAYDVTINARMDPGQKVKVEVPVEFVELGQQASGLLPATIRLIDPDRAVLASRDFTVDVRGAATSLMAIFTLVVVIATGASVVVIWIAVGRRRLPRNRWRRGLRFGLVGAGVGVALTLLLSELLLVSPKGSVWIPLLLIPAGGAFLLGWFSPGPLADDEAETEIEDWMRETVPVERPGAPARS
jgi:hypothetical protein